MQLGYSQFAHSQPYLHPFSLPMTHDPNIVANKTQQTNKKHPENKKSSFQHSGNIFNKKNSFRMWQRQTFLQMETFFFIFSFSWKKYKNWIFRKIRGFFQLHELKWPGRGEKGGTTLQPIKKKNPNPFCPPPRNYHFLPLPAQYKVFAKH